MKEEFKKEQEELQVIATEKKNDDIWSGKSYLFFYYLFVNFFPTLLKVSYIQSEFMRSTFLPKCQPKFLRISALEVY